MKLTFKNTITTLINKGLPFAIYKIPNSEYPILVVQKSLELNKVSIEEIDDIDGFIIAPFNSAKTSVISFIESDFIVKNKNIPSELENFILNQEDCTDNQYEHYHKINKEEYLEKTQYLISKLKSEELKKVVFSRIIETEIDTSFSHSDFFNELCLSYPTAFVYLLNSKESGIWIGATPETLLMKENHNVETMAVAGTRLLSEYKKDNSWKEKEKEEQNLVSIYIKSMLSELGISDYKTSEPKTIEAGKLVHLKTKFSINLEHSDSIIGKIIKCLHPTPAVCGLPKADAYNYIEKAETHKRNLYTGFLGPWNINNKSHLFVNLRCAKFNKDRMLSYVGGGLTADSIPIDEWQETENKSRTLLSIAEKM